MRTARFFFDGLDVAGVIDSKGGTIRPFPLIPLQDAASLLEKIAYLRPDRKKPLRKYKNEPHNRAEQIDDWGNGAVWYIHENRDKLVDTFIFPRPTSDTTEAMKRLDEVAVQKKEQKKLIDAVTAWLVQLGLCSTFETKAVEEGRAIEVLATPPRQGIPRPLTDIGFGVSQVLPILIKGLSVKENGMLVVEQPEAQLHPKPQSELASFFCSMIRCGRNVLVETHSEALFHRLRVLADMDKDLSEEIAIYFIDEPSVDTDGIIRCSQPRKISLKQGDEFKWPTGFLYDGVETEMQVRATRMARERKEDKH